MNCGENIRGRLFVLSAPSGSGKSTLKDRILQLFPDLVYSVSYTTRKPRPGEIDGRDYNFISEDCFKKMITQDSFLEWARVFGRYYGTGRNWVEERLALGSDVLLDVDVAGAASVRRLDPKAILIFMVPPSLSELRRRLSARRTESPEEVDRRLAEARAEIEQRFIFNYLLINDNLDQALDQMTAVITKNQGLPMAETESFWAEFMAGSKGNPS